MSRILRLRKHVLHALSVLSLLLCVATNGLWVTSHWICHTLYYARIEPTEGWLSRCDLSSAGGLFVYHHYYQAYRLLPEGSPAFGPAAKRGREWTLQRQDVRTDWVVKQLGVRGFYRLGFGFERHGFGSMDPPEYGG